MIFPL